MTGDEEFHFRVEYDDEPDDAQPTPAGFRECTGIQATSVPRSEAEARQQVEVEWAEFLPARLDRIDYGEFKRLRALAEKVHRRR